jgi:phosphohistidine phosphatase
MKVTLVRHGQARRSLDASLMDDHRVLSAEGRDAVRTTGRTLVERGVKPDQIWSSPLTRALQTAELLAGELGSEVAVEVIGCLEPGGDLGELLTRLSELPDHSDVLLTSHEPLSSRLGSILTGIAINGVGTADALRMALREAEPGKAELSWRWLSAVGRVLE